MAQRLDRRAVLVGGTTTLAAPALIRPVSARTIPQPVGYRLTRWRSDPFALGSYSYLAKGSSPRDRAILATPVDGWLYFAGETTDRDNPSTVHGAYRSGEVAAERIIRAGHRQITIVGAGMAGLTAGVMLQDAGLDVLVVEARDRIGGRVWTDRSLGMPLDLGASWIHGVDDNPLTELADDVGARRVATGDSFIGRDARGCELEWSETSRAYRRIVNLEHEYAADLGDMSDEIEEGKPFDGDHVIFPGGYDQLLAPARGALDTRLNEPVLRISRNGDTVKVETAKGSYASDAVLVTVPLGVLKAGRIKFSPDLPPDKQRAISILGMGLLDKVYLRFDRVFWDSDKSWIGRIGSDQRLFASWLNLAKYSGEPVLMAFNAASSAEELAKLPEQRVVAMAMDYLAGMYSGTCDGYERRLLFFGRERERGL